MYLRNRPFMYTPAKWKPEISTLKNETITTAMLEFFALVKKKNNLRQNSPKPIWFGYIRPSKTTATENLLVLHFGLFPQLF